MKYFLCWLPLVQGVLPARAGLATGAPSEGTPEVCSAEMSEDMRERIHDAQRRLRDGNKHEIRSLAKAWNVPKKIAGMFLLTNW